MNKSREDMIKQIIFFSIVLVIVIVLSIIINVVNSKNKKDSINNENKIKYEINGITEEELESSKPYLEENIYNEYKELFEAYKNGELTYNPKQGEEDSLEKEKEDLDDDEIMKELENLEIHKDEKGEYIYSTDENGKLTDKKIYLDTTL